MIYLLPFAGSYLYRLDGKNAISRAAWFGAMFIIAYAATFDYYLSTLLAVFALSVRFMPTNALFSAFTGQPPSRKDSPKFQWMQYFSIYIAKFFCTEKTSNKNYWKMFGVVYGAFRSIPALLMTMVVWWWTGDDTALLGLLFSLTGVVYCLSGVVCKQIRRRRNIEGSIETVAAELAMGFLIAGYMVVL
jgi:hypothetical protein